MRDTTVYEPQPTGVAVTVNLLQELHQESERFGEMTPAMFEDLADLYEFVHVPAGERFMAQGEGHDHAYTIVYGRIRQVRHNEEGRSILQLDLSRGDHVGLVFLITDRAALADTYAVRDTVLLRLSREKFEQFGQRHPGVLLNVARAIVTHAYRAIQNDQRSRSRIVNIAVVGASNHPVLADVGAALVAAAGDSVAVAHLNEASATAALGRAVIDGTDPAAHHKLSAYLDDQEHHHRLVFFDCGDAQAANDTAMRHADLILLCVAGGTTPDRERVRHILASAERGAASQRVDMLFVHDPQVVMPSGTREWLDLGSVTAHHHIRVGQRADFERVVRRVLGRAVGVALGGGGARGIAHVGVLQALTEAGIPVDYIGGTSMGSIFAGGWARGWDARVILEKVGEVFKVKNALVDLTLPVVALTAGKKLGRVLQSLYGDLRIEDLWTPFFCTSTSLGLPGAFVHQEGSLRESIRASISLPAIFPPVHLDGDLLVDGGLLDNLPVATMARLCDGGPVIAVDVGDSRRAIIDAGYHSTASGWRLIGQKLNPFRKAVTVPSLVDLVMRCTVVGSKMETERSRRFATLDLKPPVDAFGIMQFDAFEELFRVGYDHAVERLEGGGLEDLQVALAGATDGPAT